MTDSTSRPKAQCHSLPANLLNRESGQGQAQPMRQFTGESLYLDDESGGKKEGSFTPAPRLFLEAGQSRQTKLLTPFAHNHDHFDAGASAQLRNGLSVTTMQVASSARSQSS